MLPRLHLHTLNLAAAAAAVLVACSAARGAEGQAREVTIVSAYFHQGRDEAHTRVVVRAIRAAIASRRGRAGPFRVRYLDSEAGPNQNLEEACGAAARRYADNRRIVAVIGPRFSACSQALVPGLNRAGVVVVAPTEGHPGLTHTVAGRHTPATCFECVPGRFYPTGVRNYARVIAAEDSEGYAAAQLLSSLKRKRVFIVRVRGDAFSTAWLTLAFRARARSLGIRVVGTGLYTHDVPGSYRAVGARAVRSRANALLLMAPTYNDGAAVLTAIRRAGYRGVVVSSLTIVEDSILVQARRAVQGVYFTFNRLPLRALPRSATSFVTRTGTRAFGTEGVYAAEAANAVLDAIAASDGSRSGVRDALFRVRRNGLLGRLAFDANGDVRPQRVAVFQARKGRFLYRRTLTIG